MAKIKIGTNEHRFVPESFNNKELPEENQMVVVLKKAYPGDLHQCIRNGKVILRDYLALCVIRIENPFDLEDKDGSIKPLTINSLFEQPELEDLASEIVTENFTLQSRGVLDPKKQ